MTIIPKRQPLNKMNYILESGGLVPNHFDVCRCWIVQVQPILQYRCLHYQLKQCSFGVSSFRTCQVLHPFLDSELNVCGNRIWGSCIHFHVSLVQTANAIKHYHSELCHFTWYRDRTSSVLSLSTYCILGAAL